MPGQMLKMGCSGAGKMPRPLLKGKQTKMAKAQAQAKAPTHAATVAATVAAQTGTTLTQTELVAAAHAIHGHGPLHTSYHGGNCTLPGGTSGIIAGTPAPKCAGNLVTAFANKYPGATVKLTGVLPAHKVGQTSANKRFNIYNAIWAGGSLANIRAVAKANQAGFKGYADVVACVWQGWVTLHK
jgi:hypothetical protein